MSPEEQATSSSSPLALIPSKYRYLNTGMLFLSAICNSMIVQALSSINQEVVDYLPSVTNTEVSACALIFMLIHPCASLPANYILDNYSLKIGVSINAVAVIIGVAIRMLVLQGFVWVIVGNSIVAVGNAFLINCPAKYSAVWYPPRDRVLITSLLVFANTISGAFGAFLSPFFVKDGLDQQKGQHAIQQLMIMEASLIGCVMLANLIIFRGTPSVTLQQLKEQKAEKQPYLRVLLQLLKNRQFLLLSAATLLSLSALNTIMVNIELIILPFGFTSRDAGTVSIVLLPFALVSSVLTSKIIKRTRKYKRIILIGLLGSFLALLITTLGLFVGLPFLFWVGASAIGVFGFPVISNILEYACESLYPVGEATISGFMIAGGQLASFVVGIAETRILEMRTKASVLYSLSINFSFLALGFLCFWATKERLRRLNAQELHKDLSTFDSLSESHQQSILTQ